MKSRTFSPDALTLCFFYQLLLLLLMMMMMMRMLGVINKDDGCNLNQ